MIGLSVAGIAFFGLLAWYGFRIAKQLPHCSVSVDDDGLWPAHLSKETQLVRWGDVHSLRERVYLQRLDLLDSEGRILLKVEYQLVGFEALRALLIEKTIRRSTQVPVSTKFTKRFTYHVFTHGGIVGFSLIGWYVGTFNPWLGYGGIALLVTLIVHEYLTTVSGIQMFRDRLRIAFPYRSEEHFREQIEAIQMGDFYNQGARHPEVVVFIRGKDKPIRLYGLGVDAVNLHRTLEQWKQDTR